MDSSSLEPINVAVALDQIQITKKKQLLTNCLIANIKNSRNMTSKLQKESDYYKKLNVDLHNRIEGLANNLKTSYQVQEDYTNLEKKYSILNKNYDQAVNELKGHTFIESQIKELLKEKEDVIKNLKESQSKMKTSLLESKDSYKILKKKHNKLKEKLSSTDTFKLQSSKKKKNIPIETSIDTNINMSSSSDEEESSTNDINNFQFNITNRSLNKNLNESPSKNKDVPNRLSLEPIFPNTPPQSSTPSPKNAPMSFPISSELITPTNSPKKKLGEIEKTDNSSENVSNENIEEDHNEMDWLNFDDTGVSSNTSPSKKIDKVNIANGSEHAITSTSNPESVFKVPYPVKSPQSNKKQISVEAILKEMVISHGPLSPIADLPPRNELLIENESNENNNDENVSSSSLAGNNNNSGISSNGSHEEENREIIESDNSSENRDENEIEMDCPNNMSSSSEDDQSSSIDNYNCNITDKPPNKGKYSSSEEDTPLKSHSSDNVPLSNKDLSNLLHSETIEDIPMKSNLQPMSPISSPKRIKKNKNKWEGPPSHQSINTDMIQEDSNISNNNENRREKIFTNQSTNTNLDEINQSVNSFHNSDCNNQSTNKNIEMNQEKSTGTATETVKKSATMDQSTNTKSVEIKSAFAQTTYTEIGQLKRKYIHNKGTQTKTKINHAKRRKIYSESDSSDSSENNSFLRKRKSYRKHTNCCSQSRSQCNNTPPYCSPSNLNPHHNMPPYIVMSPYYFPSCGIPMNHQSGCSPAGCNSSYLPQHSPMVYPNQYASPTCGNNRDCSCESQLKSGSNKKRIFKCYGSHESKRRKCESYNFGSRRDMPEQSKQNGHCNKAQAGPSRSYQNTRNRVKNEINKKIIPDIDPLIKPDESSLDSNFDYFTYNRNVRRSHYQNSQENTFNNQQIVNNITTHSNNEYIDFDSSNDENEMSSHVPEKSTEINYSNTNSPKNLEEFSNSPFRFETENEEQTNNIRGENSYLIFSEEENNFNDFISQNNTAQINQNEHRQENQNNLLNDQHGNYNNGKIIDKLTTNFEQQPINERDNVQESVLFDKESINQLPNRLENHLETNSNKTSDKIPIVDLVLSDEGSQTQNIQETVSSSSSLEIGPFFNVPHNQDQNKNNTITSNKTWINTDFNRIDLFINHNNLENNQLPSLPVDQANTFNINTNNNFNNCTVDDPRTKIQSPSSFNTSPKKRLTFSERLFSELNSHLTPEIDICPKNDDSLKEKAITNENQIDQPDSSSSSPQLIQIFDKNYSEKNTNDTILKESTTTNTSNTYNTIDLDNNHNLSENNERSPIVTANTSSINTNDNFINCNVNTPKKSTLSFNISPKKGKKTVTFSEKINLLFSSNSSEYNNENNLEQNSKLKSLLSPEIDANLREETETNANLIDDFDYSSSPDNSDSDSDSDTNVNTILKDSRAITTSNTCINKELSSLDLFNSLPESRNEQNSKLKSPLSPKIDNHHKTDGNLPNITIPNQNQIDHLNYYSSSESSEIFEENDSDSDSNLNDSILEVSRVTSTSNTCNTRDLNSIDLFGNKQNNLERNSKLESPLEKKIVQMNSSLLPNAVENSSSKNNEKEIVQMDSPLSPDPVKIPNNKGNTIVQMESPLSPDPVEISKKITEKEIVQMDSPLSPDPVEIPDKNKGNRIVQMDSPLSPDPVETPDKNKRNKIVQMDSPLSPDAVENNSSKNNEKENDQMDSPLSPEPVEIPDKNKRNKIVQMDSPLSPDAMENNSSKNNEKENDQMDSPLSPDPVEIPDKIKGNKIVQMDSPLSPDPVEISNKNNEKENDQMDSPLSPEPVEIPDKNKRNKIVQMDSPLSPEPVEISNKNTGKENDQTDSPLSPDPVEIPDKNKGNRIVPLSPEPVEISNKNTEKENDQMDSPLSPEPVEISNKNKGNRIVQMDSPLSPEPVEISNKNNEKKIDQMDSPLSPDAVDNNLSKNNEKEINQTDSPLSPDPVKISDKYNSNFDNNVNEMISKESRVTNTCNNKIDVYSLPDCNNEQNNQVIFQSPLSPEIEHHKNDNRLKESNKITFDQFDSPLSPDPVISSNPETNVLKSGDNQQNQVPVWKLYEIDISNTLVTNSERPETPRTPFRINTSLVPSTSNNNRTSPITSIKHQDEFLKNKPLKDFYHSANSPFIETNIVTSSSKDLDELFGDISDLSISDEDINTTKKTKKLIKKKTTKLQKLRTQISSLKQNNKISIAKEEKLKKGKIIYENLIREENSEILPLHVEMMKSPAHSLARPSPPTTPTPTPTPIPIPMPIPTIEYHMERQRRLSFAKAQALLSAPTKSSNAKKTPYIIPNIITKNEFTPNKLSSIADLSFPRSSTQPLPGKESSKSEVLSPKHQAIVALKSSNKLLKVQTDCEKGSFIKRRGRPPKKTSQQIEIVNFIKEEPSTSMCDSPERHFTIDDSPLSPDWPFNDEKSPVKEKVKKNDDTFFENCLKKFINKQKLSKNKYSDELDNIDDLYENILNELENSSNIDLSLFDTLDLTSLTKILLKIIKYDDEAPVDKTHTPPAPPLSPLHQKLIGIIMTLQQNPKFQSLRSLVYKAIENYLFNLKKQRMVYEINLLARFYAALCLANNDIFKARTFLADSLYVFKFRAYPLIFNMLKIYHNILPRHEEGKDVPIVQTIVHLILSRKVQSNDLFKAVELKKFITKIYGYKLGEFMTDSLSVSFLDKIKAGHRDVKKSLVLLAKYQGWNWTCNSLINRWLIQILTEWENGSTSDDILEYTLEIISSILKPLPEAAKSTIEKIQNRLFEYYNKLHTKMNQKVEEALVCCLVHTTRASLPLVVDFLLSWQPNQNVSNKTQNTIIGIIKVFPVQKWKTLIFKKKN